jgi:hypothetical protein
MQTKKAAQAIKVVAFCEFHLKDLMPIPKMLADIYLNNGEGFTLLVDDKPIAAAGVIISEGKGSAWGLISDRARTMPLAIYKSVSQGLAGIIERNGLRRVDVIIDPERPENAPWVRHLGFHYEGRMCDFYAVGRHAEFWARTTSKCEVR